MPVPNTQPPINQPLPVWLSCDVLRLFLERPTIATILAPMLERLFLSPVPSVPTAVSDWLPSVFSSVYMSPLMLELLAMLFPDTPICLFFILDVKSLSATKCVGWSQRGVRAEEDGEEETEERGRRGGVKIRGDRKGQASATGQLQVRGYRYIHRYIYRHSDKWTDRSKVIHLLHWC